MLSQNHLRTSTEWGQYPLHVTDSSSEDVQHLRTLNSAITIQKDLARFEPWV